MPPEDRVPPEGRVRPGGDLVAGPDESFQRYARLVRAQLGVPTALVSLLTETEQVLPGALGLPEPFQTRRSTPLSHSVCRYVVDAAAPLFSADVRTDPRLDAALAVRDLGVVAYAGHPLRDADGVVVGSLCAVDHVPRVWSAQDEAVLADLAAACSAELAQRQLRERAEVAGRRAVAAGRYSRLLLALSDGLADAVTVEDVAAAVSPLASAGLGAAYAGISVVVPGSHRYRHVSADELPAAARSRWEDAPLDTSSPSGLAICAGRELFFLDRGQVLASFPGLSAQEMSPAPGARVVLPLEVAGSVLGALVLGWSAPRDFDPDARAVLRALTRYTAQAVARARLLEERRSVARTLQEAMLTVVPGLPGLAGLEVAARYVPAADGERVGGDWYDALPLTDGAAVLVVGDVTGHDIAAAALMGQLRSMTRTLAWVTGRTRSASSSVLTQLDQVVADLHLDVTATAVVVQVGPLGPDGCRRLRWSSAGHVPPLLLHAGGGVELLEGRSDLLLGVVPGAARSDHSTVLEPGATLLLYSDGLVERRGSTLAHDLERLRAAVRACAGASPDELADTLLAELVGPHPGDDVVLLAVRTGGT